ncbi:MAG: glycosyltransferase, partial [Campylobacteraceae bacterium]|nr:glycosyltransferase [Campylobacteraceae bacterium]
SKDSSLSILQQYASKDKRIKVFTQENQGPATARNVGLKNAVGKYIMFCDSDDWCEPDMCKEMFECIEKENVDIVMCDCNVVEVESDHLRNKGDDNYVKLKRKYFYDISKNSSIGIPLVLWNKIFKKSLIDNYNISFPNGYLHDDDAFIRQYISVSSSYFGLDVKLYNYVFRRNSIMSETFLRKNDLKILDKIYSAIFFYNFLAKNNLLDSKYAYFLNSLMEDIHFCWQLLHEEKYKHKVLELVDNIIKDIDSDKFLKSDKDIFIAIKNRDFQKAKKLLDKKYGTKKTLSIFGFDIFKKTKDALHKKIYLFGFLVYTKKYR